MCNKRKICYKISVPFLLFYSYSAYITSFVSIDGIFTVCKKIHKYYTDTLHLYFIQSSNRALRISTLEKS